MICELTANEHSQHYLISYMRIAKAKLAAVQAKISASATRVVDRLIDTHKVARERALATARQQRRNITEFFRVSRWAIKLRL